MTNPNILNTPGDEEATLTEVTFSGRGDFTPGWQDRIDIDGDPIDPTERRRAERVPGDDTIAVQSMSEFIKHSQTSDRSK